MSEFVTRTWCRLILAATREEGQAVTEYAVVLVLVAAVATALAGGTGIAGTIVGKITNELSKI
jgi:hypothetical protein